MRKELLYTRTGTYYSFAYYDSTTQKPVRLQKSYIRERFGKDITEMKEAESIRELLEKERHSRVNEKKLRLSWDSLSTDFSQLVADYQAYHRKTAPNSYATTMHYLRHYVCYYFLQIQKCEELDQWALHYDGFREWLEDQATVIKNASKKLSYNSKNHCIHALNTFMRFLHRKRTVMHFIACSRFPDYQLKQKSVDDIISMEEMERIYAHLKAKGLHKEAVFWRLLFFTGMRFNEARGVSLENIYEGEIEDKVFAKRLKDNQISHVGYLVLESQPVKKTLSIRGVNGEVLRKPLKGRKKIDEKSARTIPIVDSLLWRELAALYNTEIGKFQSRLWGESISNYLLFEGVNRGVLEKVYRELHIPYHSPHCCRHTRATLLIGETGDPILTRMWLGHTSQRVLDRYVHVYQSCVRKAKKGDKQMTRIEL